MILNRVPTLNLFSCGKVILTKIFFSFCSIRGLKAFAMSFLDILLGICFFSIAMVSVCLVNVNSHARFFILNMFDDFESRVHNCSSFQYSKKLSHLYTTFQWMF